MDENTPADAVEWALTEDPEAVTSDESAVAAATAPVFCFKTNTESTDTTLPVTPVRGSSQKRLTALLPKRSRADLFQKMNASDSVS